MNNSQAFLLFFQCSFSYHHHPSKSWFLFLLFHCTEHKFGAYYCSTTYKKCVFAPYHNKSTLSERYKCVSFSLSYIWTNHKILNFLQWINCSAESLLSAYWFGYKHSVMNYDDYNNNNLKLKAYIHFVVCKWLLLNLICISFNIWDICIIHTYTHKVGMMLLTLLDLFCLSYLCNFYLFIQLKFFYYNFASSVHLV